MHFSRIAGKHTVCLVFHLPVFTNNLVPLPNINLPAPPVFTQCYITIQLYQYRVTPQLLQDDYDTIPFNYLTQ